MEMCGADSIFHDSRKQSKPMLDKYNNDMLLANRELQPLAIGITMPGEIMSQKYNDAIFWQLQDCPVCGYRSGIVHTPDALAAPIEFSCKSSFRGGICRAKWGFAFDPRQKEVVRMRMKLWDEREAMFVRILEIDELLRKK